MSENETEEKKEEEVDFSYYEAGYAIFSVQFEEETGRLPNDHETEAYFCGMMEGIKSTAVWENGEEVVGVSKIPIKALVLGLLALGLKVSREKSGIVAVERKVIK